MTISPPLAADPEKLKLWELQQRAVLSEQMGERRTLEGVTRVLFEDLMAFGSITSVCLLRPRMIPLETGEQRNGQAHNGSPVYSLELVVESTSANSTAPIGQRISWGVGVAGKAAKNHQPASCVNIARASPGEYLSAPERQKTGSEFAIPLLDGSGRLLAVLEAQADDPSAFSTELRRYICQQGGVLAHHLIGVEKNEHCELTGVYNSTVFRRLAELEIASALCKEVNLSFVELDIDFIKTVNDRCGHHVGDKVLKEFGRVITRASRKSDFLIRTGGDEFYIIMPYTDYNAAIAVAARLRRRVKDEISLEYPRLQEALDIEEEHRLTFSYGAASLCHALNLLAGKDKGPFITPTEKNVTMLFDMMHQHADDEMYAMKRGEVTRD